MFLEDLDLRRLLLRSWCKGDLNWIDSVQPFLIRFNQVLSCRYPIHELQNNVLQPLSVNIFTFTICQLQPGHFSLLISLLNQFGYSIDLIVSTQPYFTWKFIPCRPCWIIIARLQKKEFRRFFSGFPTTTPRGVSWSFVKMLIHERPLKFEHTWCTVVHCFWDVYGHSVMTGVF